MSTKRNKSTYLLSITVLLFLLFSPHHLLMAAPKYKYYNLPKPDNLINKKNGLPPTPLAYFIDYNIESQRSTQLESNIEKYLKSEICKRYQSTIQTPIKAEQLKHTSWLSAPHQNAYLTKTIPLPEDNYTLALPPKQVSFRGLSELILKLAKFSRTGFSKRHPLADMPTNRLFYTRVPEMSGDLVTEYRKDTTEQLDSNATQQTIIVIRKGHYFSIPVYDKGSYCSKESLHHELELIYQTIQTDELTDISAISLTDRTHSAKLYKKLAQKNHENLKQLNQALFVVVLDDWLTSKEMQLARMQSGINGSCWHQKSIQLFFAVSPKDRAFTGFTFEHSLIDGAVMSQMLIQTINRTNHPMSVRGFETTATKLEWETSHIQITLHQVKQDTNKQSNQYGLKILTHEINLDQLNIAIDSSLNSAKPTNYSDNLVQIAMAEAAHKVFGKFPQMYESVDMSFLLGGRTEVGRTMSINSVREYIRLEPTPDRQQKLISAINDLRSYIRGLKQGLGFERILKLHRTQWIKEFQDATTWPLAQTPIEDVLTNPDIISTSQLGGSELTYFTFRTPNKKGLGIAYVIDAQKQWVRFLVNYHNPMESKALEYIEALKKALASQKELLAPSI